MSKRKSAIALGTTLMLLISLLAIQAAAVNVADIDFEIDGNTAAGDDTPGGDDWESVILGGAPDWDAGPGTLIQDGNAGPKSTVVEENIFAKGGKFGNPAGWTVEPGNTPAQNDLTNVYVNAYTASESVSGDSWIVMGMHRIKKQGTFDLDFEFNQNAWDGTSGTLVRAEGDIVVGYELSGNPEDPVADLAVLILIYEPSNTTCTGWDAVYGAGFCEVFRGTAGTLAALGAATMNAVAFPQPPWGAFDSDGSVLAETEQVEPFFFAEAAINLSEFGIDLDCPGFGSVHAKSRSSLEVTADLKDLAGPQAFEVACFIDGYKFHDLNADGVWQLGDDGEPNTGDAGEEPTLAGWQIDLSGASTDSTTTDANGYYRFDGLGVGTYTVTEVCPTGEGWIQSFPGPNPAASCGDNTHTFVVASETPTHTGNFGNFQNATKAGTKFKDADNSGTRNTGDSGLDGWTIKVYNDVDSSGTLNASDTAADSTVTAGGGDYSFSLTPGDYIVCEEAQDNWTQTAPNNTVCAGDPLDDGLADGGYAITVQSGDVDDDNDFGNTPLSNFDVNFYDLTGSTNATITCVDEDEGSVGSSATTQGDTPETTLTANAQEIGVYTCTITITDP